MSHEAMGSHPKKWRYTICIRYGGVLAIKR